MISLNVLRGYIILVTSKCENNVEAYQNGSKYNANATKNPIYFSPSKPCVVSHLEPTEHITKHPTNCDKIPLCS